MFSEAEYWKVEEHEPVNSHLRVEMSPLPTRFNRQNADDVERNADTSECERICKAFLRGLGESAARPRQQHRLAARKDKDCDRQPHQYVLSPE